jgi:predicted TIM-barrel fold metal-dependent hydrolase
MYGERHALISQIARANLVDLVFSGTLARNPDLKIVWVEWGFSWLPALLSRMDEVWAGVADVRSRLRERPSTYVLRQNWFTTQPIDEPESRIERADMYAYDAWSTQLLFSSDYPHYDTDSPDVILRKRIPAAFREAVSYRNAVNVFGERILRATGVPTGLDA